MGPWDPTFRSQENCSPIGFSITVNSENDKVELTRNRSIGRTRLAPEVWCVKANDGCGKHMVPKAQFIAYGAINDGGRGVPVD